jgi:hypothetical protein
MRGLVWVGVGCVALILVVGGWNVLAANVLHGEVTPRKLFLSVTDAADGGDPFGMDTRDICHEVFARRWTCEVTDPGGSGGFVTYLVEMEREGSCWDARTVERASSTLPRRISGCVHLKEDDD